MEQETHFIICTKLKSFGEMRSQCQCTFAWGEVKYPWSIFFFVFYQCLSHHKAIRGSWTGFGECCTVMAPPELGAFAVWPWCGVWWAQGLMISILEKWETEVLSLLHFSKIHFGFVRDETLTDGEAWAALSGSRAWQGPARWVGQELWLHGGGPPPMKSSLVHFSASRSRAV